MGTRGLTAVMADGEYKIAHYMHNDCYPGGQGATALKFCRENLLRKEGVERFRSALQRCCFVPDDKSQVIFDRGAELLYSVFASDAQEIKLHNSITFAGDSLFCEWAYCIDLDKMTFEVYRGFNKVPLDQSERFSGFDRPGEYRPIKLAASWKLTTKKLGRMPAKAQDTALRLGYRVLPTHEKFIRQLTPKDEDE